jgi:hypothetical protein
MFRNPIEQDFPATAQKLHSKTQSRYIAAADSDYDFGRTTTAMETFS